MNLIGEGVGNNDSYLLLSMRGRSILRYVAWGFFLSLLSLLLIVQFRNPKGGITELGTTVIEELRQVASIGRTLTVIPISVAEQNEPPRPQRGLPPSNDIFCRPIATIPPSPLRITRAIPDVIETLEDTSWEVRRNAAEALGMLGDHTSVQHLKKLLQDRNEDVREAAEEAIEMIEGSYPADSPPNRGFINPS